MNEKELLRVRPIDLRLPPVQNSSLPQQLARELPEHVHVNGPLKEDIPRNHLRARLDKVDRSVAVERRRGLEALHRLLVGLQ
jgi:hypothetical protein